MLQLMHTHENKRRSEGKTQAPSSKHWNNLSACVYGFWFKICSHIHIVNKCCVFFLLTFCGSLGSLRSPLFGNMFWNVFHRRFFYLSFLSRQPYSAVGCCCARATATTFTTSIAVIDSMALCVCSHNNTINCNSGSNGIWKTAKWSQKKQHLFQKFHFSYNKFRGSGPPTWEIFNFNRKLPQSHTTLRSKQRVTFHRLFLTLHLSFYRWLTHLRSRVRFGSFEQSDLLIRFK